jgi:hypothetical protein
VRLEFLWLLHNILEPVRCANTKTYALSGSGAIEGFVELLEESLFGFGGITRIAPAETHAPVSHRVQQPVLPQLERQPRPHRRAS